MSPRFRILLGSPINARRNCTSLLAITSGSRTFSARNCSLKTLRPSCQAAFTFSSVLGHSMPRSMMILLSVAIKMESV